MVSVYHILLSKLILKNLLNDLKLLRGRASDFLYVINKVPCPRDSTDVQQEVQTPGCGTYICILVAVAIGLHQVLGAF